MSKSHKRHTMGIGENNFSSNNLQLEESRRKMAQLLMNLFERWNLDTATQLILLGLSPNSRALLADYKNGSKPLPNMRDVFDRAGWLLSIHKSLRLLYPQNDNIRYSWIKRKNIAFENHAPLEIMQEQGIIGIAKVARYLDFQRGM